uniref:Ubiquitination factor E4A n=1 Tax=Mus musculus TaxID=10090 RepID=D6RGN7_MOUSE
MTDQENNNNISSNPFAALFGSLADAKQFAAIQKEQLKQQSDTLSISSFVSRGHPCVQTPFGPVAPIATSVTESGVTHLRIMRKR